MRRFRDLLKPDSRSTPKEEQERASTQLADAVAQSHLRWWKSREVMPDQEDCLLLAVAPYSQYDLTLLDLLDERLESELPLMRVYVANLLEYDSLEQLCADFPGVGDASPTPIAALFEVGSPRKVAWGKKARDMAAQALGLAADELSRRIVAESSRHANAGTP